MSAEACDDAAYASLMARDVKKKAETKKRPSVGPAPSVKTMKKEERAEESDMEGGDPEFGVAEEGEESEGEEGDEDDDVEEDMKDVKDDMPSAAPSAATVLKKPSALKKPAAAGVGLKSVMRPSHGKPAPRPVITDMAGKSSTFFKDVKYKHKLLTKDDLKTSRACLVSRAYHAAFTAALRAGKQNEDAKLFGRIAFGKVAAQWSILLAKSQDASKTVIMKGGYDEETCDETGYEEVSRLCCALLGFLRALRASGMCLHAKRSACTDRNLGTRHITFCPNVAFGLTTSCSNMLCFDTGSTTDKC